MTSSIIKQVKFNIVITHGDMQTKGEFFAKLNIPDHISNYEEFEDWHIEQIDKQIKIRTNGSMVYGEILLKTTAIDSENNEMDLGDLVFDGSKENEAITQDYYDRVKEKIEDSKYNFPGKELTNVQKLIRQYNNSNNQEPGI